MRLSYFQCEPKISVGENLYEGTCVNSILHPCGFGRYIENGFPLPPRPGLRLLDTLVGPGRAGGSREGVREWLEGPGKGSGKGRRVWERGTEKVECDDGDASLR